VITVPGFGWFAMLVILKGQWIVTQQNIGAFGIQGDNTHQTGAKSISCDMCVDHSTMQQLNHQEMTEGPCYHRIYAYATVTTGSHPMRQRMDLVAHHVEVAVHTIQPWPACPLAHAAC